ncbi:hypothetical protein [Microbacterium sp. NPDC057944]|uniref:hypothetical protein n=1 Tax=Microbacterium sp. NPDC057944 TaxID=3346286 RepID=UPI0036D97B59
MSGNQIADISRRAMLKHVGVTVGLGAVVAFSTLPLGVGLASADTGGEGGVKPDTSARDRLSASMPGFTDVAGVHAEYLAAIASFPFALPEGVEFPSASKLQESSTGEMWEKGIGEAEAYLFWHGAMVSAAQTASARGDREESNRLLNELKFAYGSKARTAIWEDDGRAFSLSLGQAVEGDFAPLSTLVS